MEVSSLMRSEIVSCAPETTLAEAARQMREYRVGFLPVVLPGTRRLLGVLTDRDALLCSLDAAQPLERLRVFDAMKKPVRTCSQVATLEEVERLMAEHRVHRLPVVDERGDLAGVISVDDLAQAATRNGDLAFEARVAQTLGAIARRGPEIAED
jgi:CBS domain-containing protein